MGHNLIEVVKPHQGDHSNLSKPVQDRAWPQSNDSSALSALSSWCNLAQPFLSCPADPKDGPAQPYNVEDARGRGKWSRSGWQWIWSWKRSEIYSGSPFSYFILGVMV